LTETLSREITSWGGTSSTNMMFPPGAPGFALSWWVVAAATLITAAFFLLVIAMLLRSRRRPVVTGKEALTGAQGEAVAWDGEQGRVLVQGEVWRARAAAPLVPGARVKVIARDGLVFVVEKA
jgi:membrane-bound serine protease (ClpP class)